MFSQGELSIDSTQGKRVYGITGEVDLREGFSILLIPNFQLFWRNLL